MIHVEMPLLFYKRRELEEYLPKKDKFENLS